MKTRSAVLVAAILLGAGPAAAGLTCSITAQPEKLSGTYSSTSQLDLQGALVLNCVRTLVDPQAWTLWIGVQQAAGRTMSKAAPYPDTLSYGVYRDTARANLWTSGPAATTGQGGLALPLDFGLLNLAATLTVPVYLRSPSGQLDKAAGTYTDSLGVELRTVNHTGALLGSTSQSSEAIVPKNCSLDLSSGGYSVSYPAFRSSALVETSRSALVTCSKGTQYQLTLDRTSGVIPGVELTYSLVFSGSGGATVSSTSASGSGVQPFGLTLTLPAGQAGLCPAGTCTGSTTRQITITY